MGGRLISIIIPIYNDASTIRKAIDSVIHQTETNWELIIIDDGSQDSTGEIVKKYLQNKKITYLYQSNSGVAAARNKGIELSKGNFLIFLDADDWFEPNLVEELNKANFWEYDFVNWWVLRYNPHSSNELWKPEKLEKVYNHITASFLAGSIGYKKLILIASGKYDEKLKFGENYELGLRISEFSNLKIKYIDKILHNYCQKNIRTSANSQNKTFTINYILKKHRNKYLNDAISHSRLLYQLGYFNEHNRTVRAARKYYCKAYKVNCLNFKALLKLIYTSIWKKA